MNKKRYKLYFGDGTKRGWWESSITELSRFYGYKNRQELTEYAEDFVKTSCGKKFKIVIARPKKKAVKRLVQK